MKNILKQKAINLRKRGHSFKEIGLALSISKSTASLWTRSVFLDEKVRLKLKKFSEIGRLRGNQVNKEKRIKLLEDIDKNCNVLKDKIYNVNDYKLFLALLYWGEGAKTDGRLIFINSDSEMVRIYLFLLRKSFLINENKFRILLHLHEYNNKDEIVHFWSNITGIPKNLFSIYNKPHTGINKKPGYKGCLSIRYGDSRILKEVFIIIDRFKNLSNIAGLV